MSNFDLSLALQCVRRNVNAYGGTVHQLRDELREKCGFDIDISNLIDSSISDKVSASIGFQSVLQLSQAGSTKREIIEAFSPPPNFDKDELESYFIGYLTALKTILGNTYLH